MRKQLLIKSQLIFLFISGFCLNVLSQSNNEYQVAIDLKNISDDRVEVRITPPATSDGEVIFAMPSIIPGTYEENNYGRLVVDFEAKDASGKSLSVNQLDDNQWLIKGAENLKTISYWVDDTFESKKNKVFEPAGTNIEEGKNFLLNLYGFVGYLKGTTKTEFSVSIQHQAELKATSAENPLAQNEELDLFRFKDYDHMTDSPVMYARPNNISFSVDDMEVEMAIYSPSGIHKAENFRSRIETTLRANKQFLGDLITTKKYAVLIYLYDDKFKPTSKNVEGALEHRSSTVMFIPEKLPNAEISETLSGVLTHEFFHTVIPLNIHSEEIHYFDYLEPKTSKHLWLYEGVTEYMAQLAQMQAGLISRDRFLVRIGNKKNNASQFDDTLPFTELSKNILSKSVNKQFFNVYMKGALIGMSLDIIIRENSSGERGIIDVLKDLSKRYGSDMPFKDEELFDVITEMTYPEVGEFFKKYVEGGTPIPYDEYLARVGVKHFSPTKSQFVFINGQVTYDAEKSLFQVKEVNSEFATQIGIQPNDYLVSFNGEKITLDNVTEVLVNKVSQVTEGENLSVGILRGNQEMMFSGKAIFKEMPFDGYGFEQLSENDPRLAVREAWLNRR